MTTAMKDEERARGFLLGNYVGNATTELVNIFQTIREEACHARDAEVAVQYREIQNVLRAVAEERDVERARSDALVLAMLHQVAWTPWPTEVADAVCAILDARKKDPPENVPSKAAVRSVT
jgi:hypothetical protein